MSRGIVMPARFRLARRHPQLYVQSLRPQASRMAADLQSRYRADRQAITGVVNPAIERLATFVDGPYRAKAPAPVGLSQYPGGRACTTS
jgi:uncharacterized protein (DUF885 family)